MPLNNNHSDGRGNTVNNIVTFPVITKKTSLRIIAYVIANTN